MVANESHTAKLNESQLGRHQLTRCFKMRDPCQCVGMWSRTQSKCHSHGWTGLGEQEEGDVVEVHLCHGDGLLSGDLMG